MGDCAGIILCQDRGIGPDKQVLTLIQNRCKPFEIKVKLGKPIEKLLKNASNISR